MLAESVTIISRDKTQMLPQLGEDIPINLEGIFRQIYEKTGYGSEITTKQISTGRVLNPLLNDFLNDFKNIRIEQGDIFKKLPKKDKADIIRCFNVMIPEEGIYTKSANIKKAVLDLGYNLRAQGYLIVGTTHLTTRYAVYKIMGDALKAIHATENSPYNFGTFRISSDKNTRKKSSSPVRDGSKEISKRLKLVLKKISQQATGKEESSDERP
jgi:hypothetical protein